MTADSTTAGGSSVPAEAAAGEPRDQKRGWLLLGGIMLAVMLLWGIVFPALTASTDFQQRQAAREEQGIDLAAFFYTDLKSIDQRRRLQQLSEDEPWSLWCPWAGNSE